MTTQQGESEVQTAYDAVADTYADFFRSTEPEQPVELAEINRFISLLPPRPKVLDAGCGAGRLMPVLHALGCDVQGVDLSPQMIRRARLDHPSFRSRVASLAHLPFEDDAFDGIFYWYSTIHSPDSDIPRILAEAKRVTRSDGFVLVAFQTGHGVQDVSENFRRRGLDIELHRYLRTADRMADLLLTARFAEVSRMVRPATGNERDGQAVLIARS